jgi:hypothetical protein
MLRNPCQKWVGEFYSWGTKVSARRAAPKVKLATLLICENGVYNRANYLATNDA